MPKRFPPRTAGVVISNNTVTVTPPSTLAYSTGYYVFIDSGAFTDSSGNTSYAGISDKTAWSFTTAADLSMYTATVNVKIDGSAADAPGDGNC